ncbi:GhoT/OrtT family toxin [Klebsiella pneumoniae subsp. pneumoniae]|nr:GhoT/OrtT family toxin [Klebsiella pneumoniae subsp. pneumoniae]
MTLYQKMLVFYAIMGVICAVISWFLTKESRMICLLAALLIGATWRVQFPDGARSSRCFNPQALDGRKG